jgi:hypothetical protein
MLWNWSRPRRQSSHAKTPPRHKRRYYRPVLEVLEDRCLPATTLTIATATDIATPTPGVNNLAPALVKEPFTQSFTAIGGSGTYSFSNSAPNGLDGLHFVASGNVYTLTGKPSAVSDTSTPFTITVNVTDSHGDSGSETYTLNVASSSLVVTPLNNATASGTTSSFPKQAICSVTGGSGPGTYTIVTNTINGDSLAPDKLTFSQGASPSQSGVTNFYVGGTPNAAGQFPAFIEIEDSYGNVVIQNFTVFVSDSGLTPTLYSTGNNGRDLPPATAGKSGYAQTFGAVGGSGSYNFTITDANGNAITSTNKLDGLQPTTSLTGVSSFTLSGTPSSPGTFAFSVTATDPNTLLIATYSYVLTVNPKALTIDTALLQPGPTNANYLLSVAELAATSNTWTEVPFQLQASGGSGNYVWTATGLPPGMALTSTGVLCGMPANASPTASGSYNVTVKVSDGATSVSKSYVLTIPAADTVTPETDGQTQPTLYYTPAQIEQAYGINQLNLLGQGITVVIIEGEDDPAITNSIDPDYDQSDLYKFNQQFNLPQFYNPNIAGTQNDPLFLKLDPNGNIVDTPFSTTDPGAADPIALGEFSQDVEWVHAIAPMANIIVIEGGDQSTLSNAEAAISAAVNWNPNNATSLASGQLTPCEQAKLQPVSVVSDSIGSTAYVADNYFIPNPAANPNNVVFVSSSGDTGAQGTSFGVSFPAYSANVLATGETMLETNAQGDYVGEEGVQNSGAGLAYTATDGTGLTGSSETQPSYQMGVVPDVYSTVADTAYRTTPDVSIVGSRSSPLVGYDSFSPTQGWDRAFGTSIAAPLWAGLIALADQGRTALGKPDLSSVPSNRYDVQALLYTLSKTKPGDFHNITNMDDGTSNPKGYNLHTGLGSPVANLLIPALIQTNSVTVQPLSYVFNPATDAIVGSFLVRNTGPAVTGIFTIVLPVLPPGVNVTTQSSVQTTLGTGQSLLLTVSFTPASAPGLDLLAKAKDSAGDVLYPVLVGDPAVS